MYVAGDALPDDVTVTDVDPEEPAATDIEPGVVHVKPTGQVVGLNENVLEPHAALSLFITCTVYDNPVPAKALCDDGVTEIVGGLRVQTAFTT